ncbi:MAG: hybrid sensor histidine kinase/response regulator [Alphaproteobacteria bacterium]|nr:hybrid sensor histidine kinase/response regulator [Alphaproteobacteria bacterium]
MSKVLIVEDSKFFANILKKQIIEELETDVEVASSFKEAKNIIESSDNDIFIAIIDLELPDAQHGVIVDYIREKNIPTVVFTAGLNDKQREDMFEKNVIDYVLKGNRESIKYVVSLISQLQKNSKIKALVVEDSSASRKYIMDILESQMFDVYEAEDGLEALKILENNPNIKLIVTDYHMPYMDGAVLTKKIRETYDREKLVIIGVSAYGSQMLSVKFLKNGANDFIHKPFLKEELICRIMQNMKLVNQIQELKKLNIQKNRFLGTVSHDLRMPLSSIIGFSQIILERDLDEEKSKQLLRYIALSGNQMNTLLDDLLDITSIESGKFKLNKKQNNLTRLVEERIKLIFEFKAKNKNIELKTKLLPVPESYFDNNRIGQVVDNLLSNALKFSPKDSLVFITTDKSDDMVIFSVSDNGQGMNIGEQKKLFDEFERLNVKPTGGEKSTGLGMSIVKKIIDAHLGEIRIKSQPEEGTTFTVALPV